MGEGNENDTKKPVNVIYGRVIHAPGPVWMSGPGGAFLRGTVVGNRWLEGKWLAQRALAKKEPS